MALSSQFEGLNNVKVRNFDLRNKWCKYITAEVNDFASSIMLAETLATSS